MRELRYLCEDELSESVLRRLLSPYEPKLVGVPWITRGGKGEVKRKLPQANAASRNGVGVIVLVDLDNTPCPPTLLADWLGKSFGLANSNLMFRVAVREIEAWLLADDTGISKLLRVPKAKVPRDVEDLPSAKETLVGLARRSQSTAIKRGLVPRAQSGLPIGPYYNDILTNFAAQGWNYRSAATTAPSLDRFLDRLAKFANETI
jgi:hypothetical protein